MRLPSPSEDQAAYNCDSIFIPTAMAVRSSIRRISDQDDMDRAANISSLMSITDDPSATAGLGMTAPNLQAAGPLNSDNDSMAAAVSRRSFRRVCVFCGSNSGNKTVFSDAALELGKELVKRRIELVYGGGNVGLMGLISKTVHHGGCHVIGVIPEALAAQQANSGGAGSTDGLEHDHHDIEAAIIGEVRVVADMHERKAEMARLADAFIALPGGYGTLEELLEMITWSQLGIHEKPVGLLNVDGYYNWLLHLFDKFVEEGFIKPGARQIVVSAPSPSDLIARMQEYVPVHDRVAPRRNWEIEQLGALINPH